jgi:hypothetical protein
MPVLHLVQIIPSYSRKTINRMHTKINVGDYKKCCISNALDGSEDNILFGG